MKNKSPFAQTIILVVIIFSGAILTLFGALLFGSIQEPLFDFRNLNFSNMIPVFVFGSLLTGFATAISLVFTSRTLLSKLKEFLDNNDKSNK